MIYYLEVMIPWMQATKVVYLGGAVKVTDSVLDLVAPYWVKLVKIHSEDRFGDPFFWWWERRILC